MSGRGQHPTYIIKNVSGVFKNNRTQINQLDMKDTRYFNVEYYQPCQKGISTP